MGESTGSVQADVVILPGWPDYPQQVSADILDSFALPISAVRLSLACAWGPALAEMALRAGARGIEDIAFRSGFPDDHALRAAFRAELGMSPRQWLARQRLGD